MKCIDRSKVMKGSTGVKLLRNALRPSNLIKRTIDRSVVHGVKCHSRVQPGSTRGWVNLLRNTLRPPKLGRKNPSPGGNALLGSKVMQRSAGVNHA